MRLLAIMFLATLSGCTTVDKFGSRAITFNEQMQQNRRAVIIDNVLRSGFGAPLQFSDVTTVTGQGSAQGSLGASLPIFGSSAGGARLYNFSPSIQGSGGPSFTVASQNGQEFLNGINTPLSNEAIAAYASSNDTRMAILLMTTAAIDFDLGARHFHFDADPEKVPQFREFQSAIGSLIAKGLTFELVDEVRYAGPPLSAEDVKGGVLAALLRATGDKPPALHHYVIDNEADADAVGALSGTERRALKGASDFYRLTTTMSKIKFCFAPPAGDNFGRQFALNAPVPALQTGLGKVGDEEVTFVAGADLQCGAGKKAGGETGVKNFTITPRTVRGIFSMLGAMAHTELATRNPMAFDLPIGTPTTVYRLFGVVPDSKGIAVTPDGRRIASTADSVDANGQTITDLSGTTISLLAELIALNSSAKNLPTPSVIPYFRN